MSSVAANGDVTVCCIDWSLSARVGNLRRETLRDIWFGKRLQAFRRITLEGGRSQLPACCNCTWNWSHPDNLDDLTPKRSRPYSTTTRITPLPAIRRPQVTPPTQSVTEHIMKDTSPVFILGSGRSGTKMMVKLLAGVEHIEAHHEYVRDAYQRDAALYFMGRLSREAMADKLQSIYGAAVLLLRSPVLHRREQQACLGRRRAGRRFPTARFVHLIRDGRKVASSFFHKLAGHVYDDRSVRILQEWLDDPDGRPMPPPPEEFWWTIPQKAQPFHAEFPGFDQFQRCCYQWVESNRNILQGLAAVPEGARMRIKLEDLTSSPAALERLLGFVDVAYDDSFMAVLQKPQHVYVPLDYPLTDVATNSI